MQQFKIGLDVDGVLANWYLGMCIKYNMPYELIDTWNVPWLLEKYHKVKGDEKFWESLPILSEPQAIIFEVAAYVTSIEEWLLDARTHWLAINGFVEAPIIVSHDKKVHCTDHGINVLVDDKLETLIDIKENAPNILPIKFTPSYMREDVPEGIYEIRHLSEVNQVLESLKIEAHV